MKGDVSQERPTSLWSLEPPVKVGTRPHPDCVLDRGSRDRQYRRVFNPTPCPSASRQSGPESRSGRSRSLGYRRPFPPLSLARSHRLHCPDARILRVPRFRRVGKVVGLAVPPRTSVLERSWVSSHRPGRLSEDAPDTSHVAGGRFGRATPVSGETCPLLFRPDPYQSPTPDSGDLVQCPNIVLRSLQT